MADDGERLQPLPEGRAAVKLKRHQVLRDDLLHWAVASERGAVDCRSTAEIPVIVTAHSPVEREDWYGPQRCWLLEGGCWHTDSDHHLVAASARQSALAVILGKGPGWDAMWRLLEEAHKAYFTREITR